MPLRLEYRAIAMQTALPVRYSRWQGRLCQFVTDSGLGKLNSKLR